MRLKRLTVRSFRGYAEEQVFDLDSRVVLLTGQNGRGKTSFFDAIEWALLGKLFRLTGNRDSQGTDYISNAFVSGSIEPFVELVLEENGQEIIIQRTGHRANLTVRAGRVEANGVNALQLLHEVLLRRPMDDKVFYQHLTRTHLLEQENLLDFLRSDRPVDRFALLSRFLGLSTIDERSDLLREAINDLRHQRLPKAIKQRDEAKQRAETTRARLDVARGLALRNAGPEEQQALTDKCRILILETHGLTGRKITQPQRFVEIPTACKEAVTTLEAAMQRWRSDRVTLAQLLERSKEWASLVEQQRELTSDLEAARSSESLLRQQMSAAKDGLDLATAALETLRKDVQASLGEQSNLSRFLEEGKRRALGQDHCPLCGQPVTYSELAGHVDGELKRISEQAKQFSRQQEEAEKAWKDAKRLHDDFVAKRDTQARLISETVNRIAQSALNQLTAELKRLQIESDEPDALISQITKRITDLDRLLGQGDSVRGKLTEVAAAADAVGRSLLVESYEQDRKQALAEVEMAEKELLAIRRAEENLVTLQRKVQLVQRDLVEELLRRYERDWQEFYYRIRPHPLFSHLQLKMSEGNEQGIFFDVIPEGPGEPKRANMIFSSGQSAGLMVVLFLTLHLHQNWTPLETIMLDDPLQTMDDINVLGLVDLLRSFATERQVILSTHDDRFASMLLNKFRSLERDRPILRYAFEGLTPMGPIVRKEESIPSRNARDAMYLRLEAN